jgi:2-dehydro-3-deoxyphosphogluconate aldolase/(4S)-4-hydroxy-2-oxoglutarate aldolase
MNNEMMSKRIASCGVVPVIALEDAHKAEPLAAALAAGGIDILEITFRTDAAADAIRSLADTSEDIVVGAGTVRTTNQAKTAIDCGARFLVTPGLSVPVVEFALEREIPIYPGINSTFALETAYGLGLRTLKFFPAEASGGVAMLKALAAPFADVQFVPTGGVTPENLLDYLSRPNVLACGGSWLTPKDALAAGDFARIQPLARDASALVRSVSE